MKHETRHASHVFHFPHGHLYLTSFPSSIRRRFRIENLVIWHTITSLALWIIWKARCDVFNNAHIHLYTMLIELWLLFLHTLRGQYDDMQSSTDVLWQRQAAFKKRWQGLHLFSDTTSGLRWNYAIPFFLSKEHILPLVLKTYQLQNTK